ncbi:radical SAM protein [Fibrella arboris]|uniref:radical SAM protein n=1 Tax=Fibrella arboris TaxID=3242486 RepID=UPI00352189F0
MMTATPIKSPHLLLRPVEDGYFYAVNCAHSHSLRLLNQAQYELLNAVDSQTDTAVLAEGFGLAPDMVDGFFRLLAQTELIRFDDQFSQPTKPDLVSSLNFWIHTTNRCNLSCGYCYIGTLNTSGGMSAAVQQQLLHKLIETVQRRGLASVKLRLAGGEPLTQFKAWQAFIPQVRERLAEVDCGLDISFLTNLTIVNDDIIAFAKAQHISFGVSLDGEGAYHDATRSLRPGVGTFDRVDANLRTLLANNIPVSTSTIITNANLVGLPDLTRYLIDIDIPFRYSIVKGEAIDAGLLDHYLTEAYAIMFEAIEEGWRFSQRHQFCDLKPNELGFQTCASGFSGGAVYVDGTVNYCHTHVGDTAKQAHSIFDEGLDLVDMIQAVSHYEGPRSTDCQTCRYKSVCTSGCPVYRVDGKDPQCSLYHQFIPLIYDLQAKERLQLLREYQMMQ